MQNYAILMDIKTHFEEDYAKINQLQGELVRACKKLKKLSARLKQEKKNLKKIKKCKKGLKVI